MVNPKKVFNKIWMKFWGKCRGENSTTDYCPWSGILSRQSHLLFLRDLVRDFEAVSFRRLLAYSTSANVTAQEIFAHTSKHDLLGTWADIFLQINCFCLLLFSFWFEVEFEKYVARNMFIDHYIILSCITLYKNVKQEDKH